jgi:hypothetical protein
MSYNVDGVPYEDRDEAILALVEEYICDTGDSATDAVGKALSDPEATADNLIANYGASIGPEEAGRDDIVTALKRLKDEGLM